MDAKESSRKRQPLNPLEGSVSKLFFRYWIMTFGSSLLPCLYSLVDMATVGQHDGPLATAALAVFTPIWNLIYWLAMTAGVGGSILFSHERGAHPEDRQTSNQIFTAALITGGLFSLALGAPLFFLARPLLDFFGADSQILPLTLAYLRPIRWSIPLFILNQILIFFLQNEGKPGRATLGVLAGGLVNIFGDLFLVFGLNWGIYGAGVASAQGCVVSFLLNASYLWDPSCTLRLVRPRVFGQTFLRVSGAGLPTAMLDLASGTLTLLFNRQIRRFFGNDALAIYGTIVDMSLFVLCCAYSLGHASQPLLTQNLASGQRDRVRQCFAWTMGGAAFFGVLWTFMAQVFPELFVRLCMKPTEPILALAPAILRPYGWAFLLMSVNIVYTFFLQSILATRKAFWISILRGVLLSGLLVYSLPALFGKKSLWIAPMVTESLVCVLALAITRPELQSAGILKTSLQK